jgi:hypothetical protein
MKKETVYLAVFVVAIQMTLGMALACNGCPGCPGCNQLDFYTNVDASGMVHVVQEGKKDVTFTNDLKVTNGGLDFTQIVESGQWKLTNLAFLEGRSVELRGFTQGSVDCEPNCGCEGRIAFYQEIDVVGNPDVVLPPPVHYDPWAYQRLEQLRDGTVLEQEVVLLPIADWSDRIDQGEHMNIVQSGLGCGGNCGDGFLAQSGRMYGDHVTAWQRGFVDGNWGYSEVHQKNTPDWVNFNQIVSFNNN